MTDAHLTSKFNVQDKNMLILFNIVIVSVLLQIATFAILLFSIIAW